MLDYIAKKIGMTHTFDDNGKSIPVTMIKLYDNMIFDLVNKEGGVNVVTLAFDKCENTKSLKKPFIGKFLKKNLPVYKHLKQSIIKDVDTFKVGNSIELESLVTIGDKISVTATTLGKGFAGAMKRWGFGGLEATHGVSVSHRSHGSTGQRQDPGKVFKGKKMAGHMGTKKVTTKNLEIIHFSKEDSLIAVKGCVPGFNGNNIILRFKA